MSQRPYKSVASNEGDLRTSQRRPSYLTEEAMDGTHPTLSYGVQDLQRSRSIGMMCDVPVWSGFPAAFTGVLTVFYQVRPAARIKNSWRRSKVHPSAVD